MSFSAIAPFLSKFSYTEAAKCLSFAGSVTTSFVASYYTIANGEKLVTNTRGFLNTLKHRFFGASRNQAQTVPELNDAAMRLV